ncbi:Rab proteins geranylgeranyltransferase component A [Ogataea parapolymorpha DL-1]|uniref:Rab proteins geranylgeranyltransferase component A n=1 Tax=Ogataea parapolymorpha (strain ATCC 26012 / BCRC 20466 / JCM 22074 / NRRL Y-7560 / DL-1) TaxID=871575 RepID=W1QH18_OGAPD|nr:Rab proteins geranylgeranyltransferase component A [Ogataea parapolymorpha DL-1]ESX00890.1 Rab proteins geranylgeranyltransferase component A [Ogataea parapolymorpha DL-1]
MGSGSGCCPQGQCIWYLSTVEKGEKARRDLEEGLSKLEESILRESEDGGFDVELTDEDVVSRPDGSISVINSVKLGKSFKEFVPQEKLTYLFKLMFTQYTSVEPFGVVNENVFKKTLKEGTENSVDYQVLYSNMPSAEISYDGIVTEAKLLYSTIVGSDDDFFDVDFEDDEEDTLAAARNDSAIVDDDDEFKDEMDFEL